MKLVHAAPIDPPADDALASLPGTVVEGRYEVLRPLGEGGMGAVFEARHVVLGQRLAMKVLHTSMTRFPGAIERLEREARAASAIGNRHIMDVRDFGTLASGQPYVVMEYLEGQQLYEEVAEGALPWCRATRIAIQVAEALGAAHDRGIVHRDLKAENIMLLTKNGEPDFVKVLDFGIAKLEDTSRRLTQAGEVLGTPHYMSPEQCAGGTVDHRTDIYALGILLYEMLTGLVPFDDPDVFEVCRMQIREAPIPPSEIVGPEAVPPALEALILCCLAKDKDARFASMGEVTAALVEVAAEASGPVRNAWSDRPSRPSHSASRSSISPRAEQRTLPMRESSPARWFVAGSIVALLTVTGAIALIGQSAWTSQPAAPTSVAPAVTPTATPPRTTSAEPEPELARSPAPPVEMLTLGSTPPGAEVTIDGQLIGRTPVRIERPRGDATESITLRAPGHEPRTVVLSALSTEELLVPLAPARPALARRGARAERPEATAATAHVETAEPEPPAARARPDAPASHTAFLDPWR